MHEFTGGRGGRGVIMLGTKLCALLKVLALAGAAIALLPEDLEDHAAPASLQEECASKCPDLDLMKVRDFLLYYRKA